MLAIIVATVVAQTPLARPAIAPPAAWVQVAPAPATLADADAPAVEVLLDDNQTRLTGDGGDYYNRRLLRVTRDEGLRELGTRSFTWDPEIDRLTLHTLTIRRGTQTIDMLADPAKALVLRREPNLERATFDGRITWTRQLDGLRVGDVVDIAWTDHRRNPVTRGRAEASDGIGGSSPIGRYRMRTSWPDRLGFQWRQAPGGVAPVETRAGGWTTLTLDVTNRTPPVLPAQAPARFGRPGAIEVANYAGWADVSRRMAPLFARAARLAPGSPVKAEAAAIMRAHADPKARAFAALQLVQQRVRYVALLMGQGGYTPATADETWERRLGDCKAKTALLLALLAEMNIAAVAATTTLPEVVTADWRLPRLGAFNHVLVKVTIAGKTYWLDGTGVTDRSGLDALNPPSWRYALPLTPAGGALERVDESVPARPYTATEIAIDASAGVAVTAPATMTLTFAGPAADGTAYGVRGSTPIVSERNFRRVIGAGASWLTIDTISWVDDPGTRTFRIIAKGRASLDWRDNPDLGRPELFPPGTAIAMPQFTQRAAGAVTPDAPYTVGYPFHQTSRTVITLPNGASGFAVRGDTIDTVAAGHSIARTASLAGNVATFMTTRRSVSFETSVTDVTATNRQLRRLPGPPQRLLGPVGVAAP